MRPSILLKIALAGALVAGSTASASAQSAPPIAASDVPSGPAPTPGRDSSSTSDGNWFTHYPWNGVNVWAGSSVQTRSASHNELLGGFFRIVGVQVSRDLVRGKRFKLAYVGEFLPAIFVRSGASVARTKRATLNAVTPQDSVNLPRYYPHDSFGVGFAPFGLEFSSRLTRNTNFLMTTTAGGVLFNHIVPYGFGTKPNFTVSPGAALQWQGMHHTGIAFGYTLHHLSNMSFGKANPGMNSHVFYLRVTRIK